jgi:broad specificity phosphatase PhoE
VDPHRGQESVVLLIRHAHTDALGRVLTGRAPGVMLSALGRGQADRLGRALAPLPLAAIYTSPLERAAATAQAIAQHQSAAITTDTDLLEIDFGEWTGLTFGELDRLADWHAFNRQRSSAIVPGGEACALVQERIVGAIARLAARHAGQIVAAISHGDVIRSAVLYVAGSSLDMYDRFEISPASVTGVAVSDATLRLLYVNQCYVETPQTLG